MWNWFSDKCVNNVKFLTLREKMETHMRKNELLFNKKASIGNIPSLTVSKAAPPPLSPPVEAGDISIWEASASQFGLSGAESWGTAPVSAPRESARESASRSSAIGWCTCWLMAVSNETKACSWGAVGVTSPEGGAVRKPSEERGGSRHEDTPPWARSPSAIREKGHVSGTFRDSVIFYQVLYVTHF